MTAFKRRPVSALAKAMLALAFAGMAAASLAADKVKIGFVSTLSGPSSALGVDIRDAFLLYVKMNGGKLGGLPAEVLVSDDQFKPDVARQLFERYVKRDHVDFMTGVVFSNIMLAALPEAIDNKVIYVSPNAAPSPMAGKDCNPWFFAVSWPNDAYHEAAGAFANQRGLKSVYLVAPNYQAGKDSLAGFKRTFKGQVVGENYTKLGQLDYAAELAEIRAAKPQVLYIFLPGGMGINFIKQFVAAGLSTEIQLIVPGFASDQDVVRAVGEPMLGLFDTSQWAYDLDNEANRKFVSGFEQEYHRIPTLYAEQGYTAALIIDQAVRDAKGKVEDEKVFHAALMKAPERAKTPRGQWKEAANGTPIQDYYVRALVKDREGRIVNKKIGTILHEHKDHWLSECSMK
jgi:branched-chain amino acid transport system substrate-binding protein